MFNPFFIKKTGENEFVAMDFETYSLIEGVKGIVILALFLTFLPVMLMLSVVYLVYKCILLCDYYGKSKVLAFIPGYNIYMLSGYACGTGWVFPVYIISLFLFFIIGIFATGRSLGGVDIMLIAGTQIVLNAGAMLFNYKFYHKLGEWGTVKKLLTFIPQLTCVLAFVNFVVAVVKIRKPKKKAAQK